MLRNILFKTLHDQRRSLVWWSVGMLALVGLTVPFYPTIRDNPQYNELISTLPTQLRAAFLAGVQDITSPEGYLNARLFTLLLPLLLLIYAIGVGTNAIAGEEERHTLDLLLAHPVKRSRVVLEKFGSLAIGVALLGLAVWVALWVGAVAIEMDIAAGKLAAATTSAVGLGLLFGTLALALGAATGKRALSLSMSAVLALGSYLIYSFASLNDRVEQVQPASPFYWYLGGEPIRNGLHVGHITALLGTTLVLLMVAVVTFNRRDVAV